MWTNEGRAGARPVLKGMSEIWPVLTHPRRKTAQQDVAGVQLFDSNELIRFMALRHTARTAYHAGDACLMK